MFSEPSNEAALVSDVERRSLKEESWREALDFRWYEGQRQGNDPGETAIREWVNCHWPGFLRARWIEHMLGIRFWVELKREEFGLLGRVLDEHRCLLEEVIHQLKRGAENLDIIRWSRRDKSKADQKLVKELLNVIDVNAHRLRCHFHDDMHCNS
jgi:hypothetical protein